VSGRKASTSVSHSDLAIVSAQLARTARDVTGIAVRCPFGRPAVIETAPTLAGKPNPTLLYLTCPSATAAISGVEAQGGVKHFKAVCREVPDLPGALAEVTRAYRRRRAALAPAGDPRPEAGIGGPESPEKASCLHAYAAALLAALAGWFDDTEGTATEAASGGGGLARAALGADTPGGAAKEAAAGAAAAAAAQAWDRFLPPRDALWCSDDRCAKWAVESDAPRVAAIDIGTISVRLLVADLREGRPEQVVRHAEITRLGEGLQPGGPLVRAARERTAAVVAGFVEEARALGAGDILLAGTSACRDAADGAEFVQTLGETHGARAVVLSGTDEATLAYTGASLDLADRPVVLDVGGGSTELIHRLPSGDIESVSLPLGASRGTEAWIKSDPPSQGEIDAAVAEARGLIEPLGPRFGAGIMGAMSATGITRLVGVAGTVTTLACIDAGLDTYDAEVIHLRKLSLASVENLITKLAGMTTAERAALPCVQAGRAPVIVAGALVVRAAMQSLGYAEMTISERDILDGLALAAPC
jgi:exopolyphosphatase/guanosine-5'-triphosphate,3'-diphosphate pyrophosphatase